MPEDSAGHRPISLTPPAEFFGAGQPRITSFPPARGRCRFPRFQAGCEHREHGGSARCSAKK